ncbi:Gar1/Naf1 RNA binding region-domain-containing protein [Schizophyllum amplum]|uniref:H/ACA ribonucleoprotein complex non-core subunit NAF1 n=1 Tax=Schizophyllum amplum TaxID=97359 RepID=A0A550CMK2_9AGAR|nr:Gar1/Naf1 RNA binding region-domain-containing protein [Auriculariopsis ampla]
MEFAVPSTVPQDLQLIQDIVGISTVTVKAEENEDSVQSSGDEDEVKKPVVAEVKPDAPDDSTSDSDSDSDSDASSDDEPPTRTTVKVEANDDDDFDEDGGIVSGAGTYLTTKNEVAETKILIPSISAVEPDEQLEKIGQIMTVLENVAIVRGIPGGPFSGVDRALDADTLLVFEDRTVFGHVYDTFGPTALPMYQVKFNSQYPLDPERVRLDREVYHVPQRSRFVFISQIKAFKGSDASNMHDEEPGEDEMEFSDDEAEAAFKAAKKKKRRGSSRDPSAGPSRHGTPSSRMGTPSPSMMRDQDLSADVTWGEALYTDPYDDSYASASHAPSLSYDDPYADYIPPATEATETVRAPSASPAPSSSGRSEAEALRPAYQPRRGRGRGRGGGGPSPSGHSGSGPPSSGHSGWSGPSQAAYNPQDSLQRGYDNSGAYPQSAQLGAYGNGWNQTVPPMQQPLMHAQPMHAQPMHAQPMHARPMHSQPMQSQPMFQTPFAQPHVNPMFFAGMGAGMPPQSFTQQNNGYGYNAPGGGYNGGFNQGQQYGGYGQSQPQQPHQYQQQHPQQNWSDQWTVPMNGAPQDGEPGGS